MITEEMNSYYVENLKINEGCWPETFNSGRIAGATSDLKCSNDIPRKKIILSGESCVGKTCILQSYANKYYNCYHNATIGCDYKRKSVVVDGLTVNLGIWDTAGQERFRTIIPHYYRKCHGAVFVYDITDISSFEAVSSWLNDFETNKTDQDCVKMLLGNKADLVPNQRQVLKEKGLEFANANNMLFFEVSAKSRVNLEAAFEELTAEMLTVPLSDEDSSPSHSLSTVTLKEGQSISSRKSSSCKC